ncbi:MAG: hypothetical protein LBQ15_03185 [Clostridium sp.]|jgi:hypothetical protein|nr:hypothetical protein [Clostridium sp.]
MKKKLILLRAGIGICAALGWWGLFYPELTMTPDTYRIVSEDGTVQAEAAGRNGPDGQTEQATSEAAGWGLDGGIYYRILESGSGRIRLKSRLLQAAAELSGRSRTQARE